MNDKLDLWTVETTDLTARVAAAIGTPSPLEAALRLLRRELAELRATTTLLAEEVARLRAASPPRRITPFAAAEGRALLS